MQCRHDQAENPATVTQHEAGRMANNGKLVSTAALKRDADRLYAQTRRMEGGRCRCHAEYIT